MATVLATPHTGLRWSRLVLQFVSLTLATSSIVFIEPAPYDVLVIVLFGIALSVGLKFPREMQIAGIFLGLCVLANLIAAVLSADPATTIRFLSTRVYLVLSWCLFASLLVAAPVGVARSIWTGYTVAALIALVWGTLEYFGFIRIEMWEGGLRAKGPFKDPNVFAPFLIPFAIYSLRMMYSHRPMPQKVIIGGLFLYTVFGILIGFSRGGWIAFICSFGFFTLLVLVTRNTLRERLQLLLVNLLVVLLVVSVLSVAVSTSSIGERFFQRAVISQAYDLKEGGRFYTQQQSLKIIGETPLGIGPGRSNYELGLQPHNVYLHMFLESGWIGGLSFFVFLFYTLYRSMALISWRSPLREDFFVVFACIAGLLLQSLFIDSTHWRHFWLLLGMNWGFIITHQRWKTGETR